LEGGCEAEKVRVGASPRGLTALSGREVRTREGGGGAGLATSEGGVKITRKNYMEEGRKVPWGEGLNRVGVDSW